MEDEVLDGQNDLVLEIFWTSALSTWKFLRLCLVIVVVHLNVLFL